MLGFVVLPIMMIIGIFFLIASIAMGVGLVLKLVFWIIIIPIRIVLWLVGLIF
jgi:hypothetical protein